MATASGQSHARVTLALDIVRKLERGEFSGYHELNTIKHQISLLDTISLRPSAELRIECTDPRVPVDSANLCWKAVVLAQREFGVKENVTLRIEKSIPAQGGLAGGSANAATTLNLLNTLWELGLEQDELCRLGRKIGMDVPYYFVGATARDTEATAVLEPIGTRTILDLVLVMPDVRVSTREAYRMIRYDRTGGDSVKTQGMAEAFRRNDREGVIDSLHNDFELSVFGAYPRLADLKNDLVDAGCLGAVMTGSGSTLVGVAGDAEHAKWVCDRVGDTCRHVTSLEDPRDVVVTAT